MTTHPTFRTSPATILIAFFICCTLLFSTLVMAGSGHSSVSGQGQSRRGNPEAGSPEANLPNLNEVRRRVHPRPETPAHVPSLMRSRRKSLMPRNGRKVGDPGTMDGAIGMARESTSGATASNNSVKENLNPKNAAKLARGAALHTSPNAFATSSALNSQTSMLPSTKRRNHAVPGGSGLSPTPIGDDQYVQTFFQWTLVRTPYTNEQNYWNDILRAAYAHAQGSMVMAAREMGKTLFESADYAARARSNHDYVYDLYKTYLLRSPDSGGWAYWESVVPAIGRENVRRAFDESGEFISKVATVTLTGSASSGVTSLLSARADLNNQSGNQLLARDAEWSSTLLSLPGRAGLDLGLAISYSSAAVWTRSGPYVYFDDDNSSLSPGFRFGFPTVQELFFNAQTGQNAYLLITAAGNRVELRQVGTGNVYEAADSSYLQLTDTSATDGKLLLRSTDGTRMTYNKIENEWRCKEVKDRNGNYLTINYNSLGDLTSVVDTLGRTITFLYDANANLSEIQQTWHRDVQSGGQANESHKWATFRWGSITVQPGFSGVALSGIANGQSIPVLTMVGVDDGTYYKFAYTNWNSGQVSRITHYASDSNPDYDNHERSHKAYTYLASDDSTRLTEIRVAGENWTGVNGVPSEVTTQYAIDGTAHTAAVVDDPNGVLYKEFYGTGWQSGLTTATEIWAGGQEKKWTSTTWTQDNTSVGYKTNPRVTETNVYDSSNNRRRTTIDYSSTFGLPSCVTDYAANASTAIRFTCRGYKNDDAFISRRIIGLPYVVNVFDGNWNLYSKTMYEYDWSESMTAQAPSMQHDTTNYGSGLSFGRGFLVGVRRYNVNAPDDNNQAVWVMRRGYNLAGGITFTKDGSDHQTNVEYTDSFSDGNNSRNTLAYPTKVKDADWNASTAPNNYATAQYNFDMGIVFRLQGPPPKDPATGQPYSQWGAIKTYYDPAGRVDTVKNEFNGGYSRYVYGPYYVQNYASVNTAGDDSYAIQTFDGAGRVVGQASNHPGSTGGYKAQLSVYDRLGQKVKQSNPAEITAGWVPAGDDAAGWLYTQQTYDWKRRALMTTNPDGTTSIASYGGCGCAGGEVVTFTDEGTIDPTDHTAKRRQQKIYRDVMGRVWKTQLLNWEGGSASATSVNTYNARDQITQVRQFSGSGPSDPADFSCPSGTCQQTSLTYDGHGRLKTKHVPEQDSNVVTTYDYFADDGVQKITDGRGAAATHTYNGRHLVTGISHSVPSGSGISAPGSVNYGYDAAGNRDSMSDDQGSKSYTYDQLSRMLSETRTLSGLGSFTFSYDYNYASELKKITDATGMTINYAYDVVGQLTNVTGSGNLHAGVSSYASGFKYRAWGGLKQFTDGRSHTTNVGYNARQQVNHFDLSAGLVNQNYDYYNDGRISVVHNTTDQNFDRSYSYDNANRLTEAKSGGDVNGYQYAPVPYHETFGYDAFSNLTSRASDSWDGFSDTDSSSYSNGRRSGWGYDVDGRNTTVGARTNGYNALGRQTSLITTAVPPTGSSYTVTRAISYDADGEMLKEVNTQSNAPGYSTTTYHLRSSVLGGAIVEELNSSGQKTVGYVWLPSGAQLATQSDGLVTWKHKTPAGTSQYTANSYNYTTGRVEFDPLGADISVTAPPEPPPAEGDGDVGAGHFGGLMDARWSDFFNLSSGCAAPGVLASCSGSIAVTNMDAEARAFFGYRWYDLPGNFDSRAQGEERYAMIYLPALSGGYGFDPAFNRLAATVTVTYSSGRVRTLTNPTLYEYEQLQTAYLADNGFSDQDEHDLSSSYNVTILGGASYFTSAKDPELPDASKSGDKQPCWRLREEIGKSVTEAFGGGFNENGDWKIRFPSGLGTKDMTRAMESRFATRFYKNLDFIEHGVRSLPFISGSHWEVMYLGDWYHFIFIGGTITDLSLAEFHYEKFRPSSNAHIKDVAKTWGKTTGEVPCNH